MSATIKRNREFPKLSLVFCRCILSGNVCVFFWEVTHSLSSEILFFSSVNRQSEKEQTGYVVARTVFMVVIKTGLVPYFNNYLSKFHKKRFSALSRYVRNHNCKMPYCFIFFSIVGVKSLIDL